TRTRSLIASALRNRCASQRPRVFHARSHVTVVARSRGALRAHARAVRAPTRVGTTFSLEFVTKGDYSPRWLRIPSAVSAHAAHPIPRRRSALRHRACGQRSSVLPARRPRRFHASPQVFVVLHC